MADEPAEVECWIRQQVLGSGGFGVVTLWKHKDKGNMIAVKKCRWGTDSLLTPKHKERWTNEVEIMQRLNHRGVVRALPVPPELERELRGELPLLCMEFCARGDLRQVLNKAENCCGLREPEVRALVRDVTNAVEYLHANKITHRDLKPENIVMQDGEAGKVTYKLIDLGYAKELDQSSMCASFVGTLQYLAPELFLSKKYSCTVDYWSLGLVAHEVITGVRPFLPSMTPVAWMTHVQRKAPDDICAYQNEDGSITFSKVLFPQNHISSCLQYHMEKWFRLLLDWDPKRRGRVSADSDQLLVFSMLNTFLDNKVVPVFCVPTSQVLHYEVDSSTELATLHQWIARDTHIPVAEQELLFPRGSAPNPSLSADQCYMPGEGPEWCLYVLRRGQLSLNKEVKPQIPPLVGSMIADAKTPVPYVFQKRAWAHAVFFLQQEASLYCHFLRAHRAKMLHVLSRTCELGRLVQRLGQEKQRASAQHQLFASALAADFAKAVEIDKSQVQQLSVLWNKEGERLALYLSQLEETFGKLETQAEGVGAQALQLQRSPFARIRIHSNLDSLAEAGQQCYETLRRRNKEERQAPQSHADMARVVYNCLKHRDRLLHDEPFTEHLKQLGLCQAATDEVLVPLNQTLQQLIDLRDEICHAQLQRQSDIWTLLSCEIAKQTQAPVAPERRASVSSSKGAVPKKSQPLPEVAKCPSSLPSAISSPPTAPTSSPVAQTFPARAAVAPPSLPPPERHPDTRGARPVPGPQSLMSLPADTSSIVQENIAIRHMFQEQMNRGFSLYKSVLTDDPVLQVEKDLARLNSHRLPKDI